MKEFKNIFDFQKHFDSEEKCREYLEQQRWNGTPACPFCGSINVCRFPNGKIFKCRENGCRSKFSVTVGTIYDNTKIPLTKWFLATYILAVHSKGISSLQLATWLGVTQKTAWHLNHRIRQMLTDTAPELLEGIVEVDETYIVLPPTPPLTFLLLACLLLSLPPMVLGAVQRGGKLKTKVISQTDIDNVNEAIGEFVAPNSTMVTDEHNAYNQVHLTYNHKTVNHREKEYVRYEDIIVHTNGIEGFWNILKKQINGIHHSVSPKHLQRYCNESAFRYNRRGSFQDERFANALANCDGTLKYKVLTGKEKK